MKDAQKPDHVSLNTLVNLPATMVASFFRTFSVSLNGALGIFGSHRVPIFLDYLHWQPTSLEG